MLEDCLSIIIIQVLCSCSAHHECLRFIFFFSLIRICFDFAIYQNLAVGQNISTEKKNHILLIIDSLLNTNISLMNTNILIKTCRVFRTLHHKES